MTDLEFNALCAELGLPGIEPARKRHTVFVGTKSITYYETIEAADAEVARLKASGYADVRISTSNF